MGYVWSRPVAVPVPVPVRQPTVRQTTVRQTTVRPDQVTPEFLAGVRGAVVTLDCRTCAYDDDAMRAVCEAAGGQHKVALQL